MSAFSRVSLFFSLALPVVLLSGCGTTVPGIQEFPGDSVEGQSFLVRAIVHSVHCEIRNAVNYVIEQDKSVAKLNRGVRSAAWFEKWGVQVGLTLQVEEKTTVSPNFVSFPPSPVTSIFSLAGGVTASSDALRIDKLNFYYNVMELKKQGSCVPRDNTDAPSGSLLIQSDLKLKEWLESALLTVGTGDVVFPPAPPRC